MDKEFSSSTGVLLRADLTGHGERPLMMSNIRVGRGSKIAPKMGHYRVGQGR